VKKSKSQLHDAAFSGLGSNPQVRRPISTMPHEMPEPPKDAASKLFDKLYIFSGRQTR